MLLELSALLVGSGLLLLVVGVFIARQYTLRAKLVTAFMIIVLLSLAVLAVLDGYVMRGNLVDGANKSLSSAAKNYAQKIDQFNRQNTKFLETEAGLPSINSFITRNAEPPFNRQTMLEILRALKSRQGDTIQSYAILNKQGINILDTNIENIGTDEGQQDYYSVLVSRNFANKNTILNYRSPIIFSGRVSQVSMVFSSAILDLSGKFIGVLRAKYDAEVYGEFFERKKELAGRGSFAILLDENYLRLVHGRRADLKYTLSRKLSSEKIKTLQKNKRLPNNFHKGFYEKDEWVSRVEKVTFTNPIVEAEFYGLGAVLFSSAVMKLETVPWTIIISQPQSVFLEPVVEQRQTALLVVAAITLLVVLIVVGATRFLLGPVKRLTAVVEDIANGDLQAKASIEADDEIGSLAHAFNDMTKSINNLIVDLEDEVGDHKLTTESLRKLSQAIEQSPVSVMITDLKGIIEYVNPQLCAVTGYEERELIGENSRILKSSHTPDVQFTNMWSAIIGGHSWTGELYNKKKNGDLFWENVTVSPIKNKNNKNTHYLAIKEDISLRKDYEERLLYQASYDKLTDLPNRSLAYDRIQQAIANAVVKEKHLAILYMDFDNFKNINDTLGHEAGDEFLKYMARRLKSCVQDFDTVARLGGDEFLIMLVENDLSGEEEVTSFEDVVKRKTEEILNHISRPCVIQKMEFSVTASVGVAIFPQDGDDPHVLLRNSDTAMYRSKRKGRATYEMFTQEMGDVVMKQVEIDTKLRHALDNGDFYLKYQALLDVETQTIVGAEALIRWEDEILGKVSPDEFIPLAEESGLIVDIGNWVLDAALAAVKQWREKTDSKDVYIAINLSSRQFRAKDIVQKIEEKLKHFDLPGSCLELEITERLLMKDVPLVINILNQFKAMGIRLSIDDFGTGYSSLSYLKRFPFDVLKIDRSFISGIGENPDDSALCDAIIAMSHSLGLNIIGEGVETQEQFNYLNERGVEILQGYYISEPMLADDFLSFISRADRPDTTV